MSRATLFFFLLLFIGDSVFVFKWFALVGEWAEVETPESVGVEFSQGAWRQRQSPSCDVLSCDAVTSSYWARNSHTLLHHVVPLRLGSHVPPQTACFLGVPPAGGSLSARPCGCWRVRAVCWPGPEPRRRAAPAPAAACGTRICAGNNNNNTTQ